MSRKHLPQHLCDRVRAQAGNRCVYCRSPQHLVLGWLEIEHIIPQAGGGSDEEDNLWLGCRLCNNYQSDQVEGLDPVTGTRVRLYDPRRQVWSEHFKWSEEGTQIIGLTPCGRVTAICLRLNNPIAVMVRQAWVSVGWHPPQEAAS